MRKKCLGFVLMVLLFSIIFTGNLNAQTVEIDNRLVLEEGFIWSGVLRETRQNMGFIFKADGTFQRFFLNPTNRGWETRGGGTWSTNGNTLTITFEDEIANSGNRTQYSIRNNRLTIDRDVFTKIAANIGNINTQTNAQMNDKTFTLTNIPSQYNGKYVSIEGIANGWSGAIDNFQYNNFQGSLISNGRVTVTLKYYSGDHYTNTQTLNILILIYDSPNIFRASSPIAGVEFNAVTFSNDTATVSYQNADVINVR